MKKIIVKIIKCIVSLILVALLAIVVTSVSLVYNFDEPNPFSGKDVFNPYLNFDSNVGWSRANFHTHTRVEGPLNECEYTPQQTLDAYVPYGYDIITISNHNEITSHPVSDSRAYEHGYNIAKFHKLVFGAEKVWAFDNLFPIFPFQKQFQLDMLAKQSDFVVLNHPLRTHTMTNSQLAKIGGYRIIELDSGKSTENEYWDAALSAGRYSFGVANDDLHYPDRSYAIAMRSNMLCTQGVGYNDIRRTLLDGCFYAMRTPDYGSGDWAIKAERNNSIPTIGNIGLTDCGEIYLKLSEKADSIKVIGQNHTILAVANDTDSLGYAMRPTDSYGRFTAYFADGEVIYTNPFARYNAEVAESPFATMYNVNMVLTVLYNIVVAVLAMFIVFLFYKLIKL